MTGLVEMPLAWMLGFLVGGSLLVSAFWMVGVLLVRRWWWGRTHWLVLLSPSTQEAQVVRRRPGREHVIKRKGRDPMRVALREGFRYPGVGAGLWLMDADTPGNMGAQVRLPPRQIRRDGSTWPERAWTDATHYWSLCQMRISELVDAAGSKWDALTRALPWLVLLVLLGVAVILGVVVWMARQVGGS